MDQRMLLAIGLSMVVMVAFTLLLPPQEPPTEPEAPGAAPTAESAMPAQPAPGTGEPAAAEAEPAPQAPDRATPPAAAPEVEVETPNYVARISTRGGELVSLRLKHYQVGKDHINWGDVIPALAQYFPDPPFDPTANVEMVSRTLPGPGLLGVRMVENAPLTDRLRATVFSADRERLELRPGDEGGRITLTGRTEDGLTLRKTLTFHPDDYTIGYRVAVINYGTDSQTVRIQHMFGHGAEPTQDEEVAYGHIGPMFRVDESLETEDADELERLFPVRDPDWVALAEPYFLTAASTDSTIAYAFYQGERNPVPDARREWLARMGMELPVVTLDPNKQVESEFLLYLGPKAEEELAKFSESLREALDITLAVLAKPLLNMLRWFHGFVGNWGVAIILLTILVRVALFPLTYKGMVSMKRMQKLQPKMTALREKHKNDREKMNREMMGLYKRYKVNPLGGCLPILLQLPIFFALYSALSSAIELRHTPFFGWLTDLSAMDGLFILPLLMGASMVIQQRLTPTTMDPTQAKIMMWMPVIFTAFMFTFPSGLVLYWFTSNLLSILQQLVINRAKIPELVERTA